MNKLKKKQFNVLSYYIALIIFIMFFYTQVYASGTIMSATDVGDMFVLITGTVLYMILGFGSAAYLLIYPLIMLNEV